MAAQLRMSRHHDRAPFRPDAVALADAAFKSPWKPTHRQLEALVDEVAHRLGWDGPSDRLVHAAPRSRGQAHLSPRLQAGEPLALPGPPEELRRGQARQSPRSRGRSRGDHHSRGGRGRAERRPLPSLRHGHRAGSARTRSPGVVGGPRAESATEPRRVVLLLQCTEATRAITRRLVDQRRGLS